MVEVGVILCLPLLIVGGLIAFSLPFKSALTACVVGCIILALLSAATCFIGVKTRLTTALITEQAMGTVPARIVSAVILLSFLGWWGFQTEIMAQTFDAILKNEGWNLPRWFSIGICGAVMITTSVLGSGAIGKVAYVLVPIKILALIALLLFLKSDTNISTFLEFVPPSPLSFGQVLGIIVGGIIVAVVGYPDFSRFLKTEKDAYIAAGGIFGTMALIYFVAIILSIAYNTSNIVLVLPTLGYAPIALLLVFFATWAANDKNLYGATIGISAFTNRLSRAQITIIAGLVGVLFAYIGIFNNLVTILTLLGVVISPILPIYVIHYFRNKAAFGSGRHSPVSTDLISIAAWAGGFFVGLATTSKTNLGLELFTLTTAPAIDACLATAIIYLISLPVRRKGQ